MHPEHLMFGGGTTESNMHPVVLVAMILASCLTLLLPRKWAFAPLLFLTFLSPLGQQLYIAGVHVFAVRFVILFGWIRIAWAKLSSRLGLLPGGLNPIDVALILEFVFRATAILVDYHEWGAFINLCGAFWDVVGGYFLFRFLIRDEEDIRRSIKVLAIISVILVTSMMNEKFHHQNLFGFLGGVPLIPQTRDGVIRSQGPFAHAILAGVFGATLFPLFVLLWKNKESKFWGIAGVVSSSLIVWSAASSTPWMAYAGGIIGICFWPFRKQMRLFRWALATMLTALHLVMKAPVWMLIGRIDLIGGNSGWHRAELIDICVKHFRDWWLIGSVDYVNWGLEMWDVGNTYVAEAESGGLATLICFVAILSIGFSRLGTARKSVEGDSKREWYFWLLGAALFAHAVAFFGITYFDQMKFAWFAFLAIISAATAPLLVEKTVPGQEAVQAVGALTAEPVIGLHSQARKSVKRLETDGKMAWMSRSKKEMGVGFADLPKEARLQTRDGLFSQGSLEQLRLGKPAFPGTTQPPRGTQTDKWMSLVLDLTSQGGIAEHHEERQSQSLRPSPQPRPASADLPAPPLVSVPTPTLIPASDAVIGGKPVERPTFVDPPTNRSTEPCDKASADLKPKTTLPVPNVDVGAPVDTILRSKTTEVTLASDALSGKTSQPSAIVSNRTTKPQAANPFRTTQASVSSASLSEGSSTEARALLGINRVAPREPGSADPPANLKSTHAIPTETKAENDAPRQSSPAAQAPPAKTTDRHSELPCLEIPEPRLPFQKKTVDSLWAELSPRAVSWLAGRPLPLRDLLVVAVLCITITYTCIGLGIAIGLRTSKRAPNIASASGHATRRDSSQVDTLNGKSLLSKPIGSTDSAANNYLRSADEPITQGRISRAIPSASRNANIEIPISPLPAPADEKSAMTRSDSANSRVAPVATSANSKAVSAPVIPSTLPTPFLHSSGGEPPASDAALRAQESPDRAVPPHLIYRVEPLYPKEALQQRLEGAVKIHVIVGLDGRVKNLSVVSGPALLTSAALDAAQYWRYMPALRDGKPVETEEDISVEFHFVN